MLRTDEVRQVTEFAAGRLSPPEVPNDFTERLREQREAWETLHQSRLGKKTPEELRVLYLCGPAPLNDLNELMALGVDPHNVWAVTSNQNDLKQAVEQVRQSGLPLKVHHGNLAEFFEHFPDSFDIAYLDGCGPFASGTPNTLKPVFNLLVGQRLSSLGVLITTFSEPPSEGAAADNYIDVMTAYFRYRYRDLPAEAHNAGVDSAIEQHDPIELQRFIKANPGLMYSEFITKLLVELGCYCVPSCRALALKALRSAYVAPRQEAKSAKAAAANAASDAKSVEELARTAGDRVLSPSSYPLLSFLEQLKAGQSSLASQLGNLRIGGCEMGDLLQNVSLLDKVFEGHWEMLGEKMKLALALSWFDRNCPFSCDAPLPNLLITALLGVYGRPWFVNPEPSLRLRYRAKSNEMYCDLLVLDQCRSLFDWWPTVDLCPSRFESREFQVLARSLIDRIGWHNWGSDSHPFRGGAVAGMGELGCARSYEFAPREEITAEGE